MGKMIIIEEKAEMMVDKLEKVKECIEDIIDCFSETMEGYRKEDYDDEDDWDAEYEVKRRKGSRRGYRSSMRQGTGGYNRGGSRY